MLYDTVEQLEERGNSGDWAFIEHAGDSQYGPMAYIYLYLPVDIRPRALRLRTPDLVGDLPAVWDWDGNRESPTLSPSILCRVTGWHGWLRAGVLVSA